MKIEPSEIGWILTKHGRPMNTPSRTKKSLLIGYDLMPLIGLRRVEKRFRTPPYDIVKIRIEASPKSRRLWGSAIKGKLSMKMAAYSVIESSKEQTKLSTAGYILYHMPAHLTEYEKTLLGKYWIRLQPMQGARFRKDRAAIDAIFNRQHITVVPVHYVKARRA